MPAPPEGWPGRAPDLPPLLVEGLVQICTVTPDLQASVDGYLGLGLGPFALYHLDTTKESRAVYRGRPAHFKYDCAFTQDHAFEVSQPVEGDSMFSDFLAEVDGRATYQHIAIRPTLDFDATVAAFEARGYETVMTMTHWEVVRVHYFSNGGTVIELNDLPAGFVAPPPAEWLGAAGRPSG